jgi:hypothetical protein
MLNYFQRLQGNNYKDMSARDFQLYMKSLLSLFGDIQLEVKVPNRGDGRTGKIDLLLKVKDKKIVFEFDRKTPRTKSIYKLQHFQADERYIITRNPFNIIQV